MNGIEALAELRRELTPEILPLSDLSNFWKIAEEPIPHVFQAGIALGTFGVLASEPGLGKSYMALLLGLSVALNRELVPAWITGSYPNLAVRISRHPLVQALCLAFGGPIVSTSANPAGLPPAKTAAEVRRYFGNQIPFCAGETGNAARPSTIRDLLTGEVLRE